ncbi:DUF2586 domain-containing protein [Sporomusa sphaeroides DSM 2875]|uniref:DUF2586 domain-containing protein n=1 Tax=Sporomusa sphaeroides TaxID=47679 RepID=UPI00202E0BF0|nr:DUF2586 domain-containing protein [Sporomusa sphaeroides DSM 2875]
MALSDVNILIKDGGLGIQPSSGTGTHAKIGVSSAGTIGEIVSVTEGDQIAGKFGTGPLANALADSYMTGSRYMYTVRAEGDVSGSIGQITASKSGTGTFAVTGIPLDEYDVIVKIIDTGRFNSATFQYSLDGGDTYSKLITVPAGNGEYTVSGTGLKFTFTEGQDEPQNSFRAGDKFAFKTVAPTASVSSINAAIDALFESKYTFEGIHIVGISSASLWAALAARADEAESRFRYLYFLAEARGLDPNETVDTWVNALLTSGSGFSHPRVGVCAGRLEISDYFTGRVIERNGAGIFGGRVMKCKVMESAGKVMLGSLPGVVSLRPVGLNSGHIAALDEGRFITFREYEGLNGQYVTDFRLMASVVSDYQYGEYRRVMDKACRAVRIAGLRYKNAEASDNGLNDFEAYLRQPLNIMSSPDVGEITAGRVIIPRDQDILATSKLRVKVRIQPVGIMRDIEIEIGMENPYLTGGTA